MASSKSKNPTRKQTTRRTPKAPAAETRDVHGYRLLTPIEIQTTCQLINDMAVVTESPALIGLISVLQNHLVAVSLGRAFNEDVPTEIGSVEDEALSIGHALFQQCSAAIDDGLDRLQSRTYQDIIKVMAVLAGEETGKAAQL